MSPDTLVDDDLKVYLSSQAFFFTQPLIFVPRHDYTVSRFLPFALLRFNTSLPPLVLIRCKKPCVLFLLIVLG